MASAIKDLELVLGPTVRYKSHGNESQISRFIKYLLCFHLAWFIPSKLTFFNFFFVWLAVTLKLSRVQKRQTYQSGVISNFRDGQPGFRFGKAAEVGGCSVVSMSLTLTSPTKINFCCAIWIFSASKMIQIPYKEFVAGLCIEKQLDLHSNPRWLDFLFAGFLHLPCWVVKGVTVMLVSSADCAWTLWFWSTSVRLTLTVFSFVFLTIDASFSVVTFYDKIYSIRCEKSSYLFFWP